MLTLQENLVMPIFLLKCTKSHHFLSQLQGISFFSTITGVFTCHVLRVLIWPPIFHSSFIQGIYLQLFFTLTMVVCFNKPASQFLRNHFGIPSLGGHKIGCEHPSCSSLNHAWVFPSHSVHALELSEPYSFCMCSAIGNIPVSCCINMVAMAEATNASYIITNLISIAKPPSLFLSIQMSVCQFVHPSPPSSSSIHPSIWLAGQPVSSSAHSSMVNTRSTMEHRYLRVSESMTTKANFTIIRILEGDMAAAWEVLIHIKFGHFCGPWWMMSRYIVFSLVYSESISSIHPEVDK